jgi:hypothetical protein
MSTVSLSEANILVCLTIHQLKQCVTKAIESKLSKISSCPKYTTKMKIINLVLSCPEAKRLALIEVDKSPKKNYFIPDFSFNLDDGKEAKFTDYTHCGQLGGEFCTRPPGMNDGEQTKCAAHNKKCREVVLYQKEQSEQSEIDLIPHGKKLTDAEIEFVKKYHPDNYTEEKWKERMDDLKITLPLMFKCAALDLNLEKVEKIGNNNHTILKKVEHENRMLLDENRAIFEKADRENRMIREKLENEKRIVFEQLEKLNQAWKLRQVSTNDEKSMLVESSSKKRYAPSEDQILVNPFNRIVKLRTIS